MEKKKKLMKTKESSTVNYTGTRAHSDLPSDPNAEIYH